MVPHFDTEIRNSHCTKITCSQLNKADDKVLACVLTHHTNNLPTCTTSSCSCSLLLDGQRIWVPSAVVAMGGWT